MKSVCIWPNSGKANIDDAVVQASAQLIACGAQVLLPSDYVKHTVLPAQVQYVDTQRAVELCDFVLCLGGDGTILRVSELVARYEKPLIGINLGHIGFMTELERGEMSKLQKIFEGKYEIDQRMMLDVTVHRGDKVIFRQHALNDAIITKSNPFRVITLGISADGVPVTSFRGDGVIITTPTGSTAYSLSAGGPVIEPTAENIGVTPICAHNLQARSFVFAPNRQICITANGPEDTTMSLATDGQNSVEILAGDRVFVGRSSLLTRLIRVKGRSFYHLLQYKLSNGGVQA